MLILFILSKPQLDFMNIINCWISIFIIFVSLTPVDAVLENSEKSSNKTQFQFAVIEYDGGSWEYGRVEMLRLVHAYIPNFLKWLNAQNILSTKEQPDILKLSDPRIFDYPMIYIAGHYDFNLSDEEKQNLKTYWERGGFVYIDDFYAHPVLVQKYGLFSKKMKSLLESFFPHGKLELIPKSHEIYKYPYELPRNKPLQMDPSKYDPEKDDIVPLGGPDDGKVGCRIFLNGFYDKDRMVAFYSDAATNRCGTVSLIGLQNTTTHEKSLKLSANVLTYVMTH